MIGTLDESAVSQQTLDHYIPLLGAAEIDELRALAGSIKGRRGRMVNSPAVGGGVAEMLTRLLPLMTDVGLAISWDVLAGGPDFFEVTKAFHNGLHGAPYEAKPADFEIFRKYNELNRPLVRHEADFTVMHDPQPSALIDARTDRGGHLITRCHIDLSPPHPPARDSPQHYLPLHP